MTTWGRLLALKNRRLFSASILQTHTPPRPSSLPATSYHNYPPPYQRNGMPKLKLKRFDPTTIPSDRLVLMVAPRGSGKV